MNELINQINNAKRLGLSIAEVTEAKKQLAIALAKVTFDANQALDFDPFELNESDRYVKDLGEPWDEYSKRLFKLIHG